MVGRGPATIKSGLNLKTDIKTLIKGKGEKSGPLEKGFRAGKILDSSLNGL